LIWKTSPFTAVTGATERTIPSLEKKEISKQFIPVVIE
jgi:hypothetical protein